MKVTSDCPSPPPEDREEIIIPVSLLYPRQREREEEKSDGERERDGGDKKNTSMRTAVGSRLFMSAWFSSHADESTPPRDEAAL